MTQREPISMRLSRRIPALVLDLTKAEPTSRSATEHRYGARGSLAICTSGPRLGSWHDHEAGVGGGPVELIAHLRRCPTKAAVKWALAWLSDRAAYTPAADAVTLRRAKPPPVDKTPFAMELWRLAGQLAGSLAEIYLLRRELEAPNDAPMRFHGRCRRGDDILPAMVALMTDPLTGNPCGIHRTFLAADGRKAPSGANGEPSKMMLGHAGVIRLCPDSEVTLGIGIAEGIETALAVMQHFGWQPVWAASSAGAIRNFPVLPGIEALTIFADADSAGRKAALACAARWRAADREAHICTPPRGDFDDLARSFPR